MLMEPAERQPQYSVIRSEPRIVYSTERNGGFVPIIPRYSRISRLVRTEPIHTIAEKNPIAAEQKFYPNFRNSAPTAHSRPFTRPNTAAAIAGRYSVDRSFDPAILGSGDFDVIQGGTFYPEGEHVVRPKISDFYKGTPTVFGSKNGHSRPNPQAFRGPRPYYPEDPFEHFRDFADINAGDAGNAFSHYVVVYANKNSTKPHPTHNSPKNIFEQLQLLDQEKEDELAFPDYDTDDVLDKQKYKKTTKVSKFKTKLAATKLEKKYKKKASPKDFADYTDPLLAES